MRAAAALGVLMAAIAAAGLGCQKGPPPAPGGMPRAAAGQELFATIHTTAGDIGVRLFSKDAPRTVENFVGLAAGEKEWTHPGTDEKQKGVPLYDGTIFHRCIKEFMIQ